MNWRMALGSMLAVAALAATAAAGPLFGVKVRAKIPFAFQADGKSFQAGTYYLESTQWQGVLILTDDAGHGRLLATRPLGNPGAPVDPRLSFTRTKSGMILSEVWMNSNTGGHKLNAPAGSAADKVQVAMVQR